MTRTSDFLSNRSGSVGVIMAGCLTVLLLASGTAVDYARGARVRSQLQAATDTAVLAGASMSAASDRERETRARRVFDENAAALGMQFSVTFSARNGQVKANASMQLPTSIMKIANFDTLPISVSSAAEVIKPPLDVFLILDMSASMGIAADANERARLMALTRTWIQSTNTGFNTSHPNGCAFACHESVGYEPSGTNSYDLARQNGIRLREDVLKDAAGTFLDTIFAPQSANTDLRVGIIGFSNTARWLIQPTDNKQAAIRALDTFPFPEYQDTLIEDAVPWAIAQANAVSSGREKVFVLVTDGVRGGKTRNFVWSPVSSQTCNALKAAGTSSYVLEVKYEDLSGDEFFDFYVDSFYASITPALQACATPGQHLSASTPSEIIAAFEQLAERVPIRSPRLTN